MKNYKLVKKIKSKKTNLSSLKNERDRKYIFYLESNLKVNEAEADIDNLEQELMDKLKQ